MQAFDEISIRLPDGYEAHARLFHAEPSEQYPQCRGAVLYFHGIQSHCAWYEESARRLQKAGFTVLQPDRRGSGRNQRNRGHADSQQQLIDDGFACQDRLLTESGQEKAHLLGVSWGGKLAIAMHATRFDLTESLILVTPGIFPMVGVSKAEMFRIGMSMVSAPGRHYDIPLNDPTMFTSDPERIEFLRNDPLQLHQATAGFFLASRRMDRIISKLQKAPPEARTPLFLLLAADERIIDNEKTRDFAHNLGWQETVIATYEQSRHTLEFDPDRETYFADIVKWAENPGNTTS